MATKLNSFHITDVIYDSEIRKLTYNLVIDGNHIERVSIGLSTDDEIADDFQKVIGKYFAKT